jgi:hypothetical protein
MATLQRSLGVIRILVCVACVAGLPSQVGAQTNLPEPRFLQELQEQRYPTSTITSQSRRRGCISVIRSRCSATRR